MPEIAIMIEGQDGLNWPRWQRIARAVEELGFAGLFRSDHFTNSDLPYKDSLEMWVSLTWLAGHTSRIAFGPLVSPVSFRDPVFTARTALQVDDLSGGRLRLGVGAGWQEREHHTFGYDLLDVRERFDRFVEGLEVILRLMRSDTPVSYQGQYYRLNEALLLPRPQRAGGPPLVIGGNGEKRTLPLAAKFADEWNGVDQPAERYAALNQRLNELLEENGRGAGAVRRTLMTSLLFGRNQSELDQKLGGRDLVSLAARGVVFGSGAQVKEQLAELGEAGAERVMLRWFHMDDMDGLEAFAKAVL